MARNKFHKLQRVNHLSNVTFSVLNETRLPGSYPWYHERYDGMERILELGCGKGEHSLAFAAANPGRLYVGVDRKSDRMCVGAEEALARGLDNVHFLRAGAERVREFFTDRCIHEIWLTFPLPHHAGSKMKHRLTAPPFLDIYAHLLKPGGKVHLKTDSELLYRYTRDSVEQWGGQVIIETNDLHANDDAVLEGRNVVSAFEKTACSQGRSIKYLAFTVN